MDDKTKSIVAHITFVGSLIALALNQTEKGENTVFYIRQNLGLNFLWIAVGAIISLFANPFFDQNVLFTVFILFFILWSISFIGAIMGKKQEVPIFGEMFQKWFKTIE